MLGVAYYDGLLELYESKSNWSHVLTLTFNSNLSTIRFLGDTLYTIGYDLTAESINMNSNTKSRLPYNDIRNILTVKSSFVYESVSNDLVQGTAVI